mgnify:FL=1
MYEDKIDICTKAIKKIYSDRAGIILPKFDLYFHDLSDYGDRGRMVSIAGFFLKKPDNFDEDLEKLVLELYHENSQFKEHIRNGPCRNTSNKIKDTEKKKTQESLLKRLNLEHLSNFYNKLKHPFSYKHLVVLDTNINWFENTNSKLHLLEILAHELWHVYELEAVNRNNFFPLIREGTAMYAANRLVYKESEIPWTDDTIEKCPDYLKFKYIVPAKIVQDYMKDKDDLKVLFRPEVRMKINEEVKKQLKLLMLKDLQ